MNVFSKLLVFLESFGEYKMIDEKFYETVPFRLSDLPPEAFAKVLTQMDTMTVFDLSLLSKQIRHKIQLVKLPFDCIEVHNVGRMKKVIFRKNYKEPELTFSFDERYYDWGWKILVGKEMVEVRGRKPLESEYCCQSKHFEADVKNLLDYFSTIFHFNSGYASIELCQRSNKLRELIEHPIFNNRLVIKLNGNLRPAYNGLPRLLHSYKNLEGLTVNFHFDRRQFDPTEIFSYNRVCFVDAKFFTRRDLLTYEFQRLRLIWHKLHGDDVNAFIKQWLTGRNQKLHRLELSTAFGNDIEVEHVIHGLDTRDWDAGQRDGDYLIDTIQSPYTIDARGGYDIRRADGTLATILFTKTAFFFLVWKVPFSEGSFPTAPFNKAHNL